MQVGKGQLLQQWPVLVALFVVLIWGLNVVMMKVAVTGLSPVLFTALRFALVAALLWPFWRVEAWIRWPVIRVALTMGVGHFLLLSLGVQYVDSALAGILLLLGGPLSMLLAYLFLQERLSRRQLTALLLAMLGVIGPTLLLATADIQIGALLILLCELMWAWGNLQVRRLAKVPVYTLNFWTAAVTAPLCGLWLSLSDFDWQAVDWNMASLGAVAYVALASSILAYGLWYQLINLHGVQRFASLTLVQPLITALAGYLILQESLHPWQWAGGGLTLLAIYRFYRG
ncbi:DMT family transporter [Balneatrix alpica]|uniref:DMT family transporter n=1 Tax=Balneatrix alpica TaxID=75684 RepID=UPI002739AA26|nr:DMT family transporter [Balneatrix alpica]